MIRDITLGQYFPGDSVIHRLDPRTKIIWTFFYIILLFFMMTGETPLFKIWFLTATKEGVIFAALMALRLVLLVAGTSLLTFTTSPISLTDGIERLMSPFSKIGVPAHAIAMMMTIAIRFIPTLLEETDKIMKAQKARGADFESGSIVSRARAMTPILIPLFISAFRRADELAIAMECRCYRGGEGRTRLHELKMQKRDIAALLSMPFVAAVIILIQKMF